MVNTHSCLISSSATQRREQEQMEMFKITRNNQIQRNEESKGNDNKQYFLQAQGLKIFFNGGRAKEFHLKAMLQQELTLENTPHTQAGDVIINGEHYNVKSRHCTIKVLTVKTRSQARYIDNYIKEDASKGLVYIVEINNDLIAIKMNWREGKKFLKKFAYYSKTENKYTVHSEDTTVYKWAKAKTKSLAHCENLFNKKVLIKGCKSLTLA